MVLPGSIMSGPPHTSTQAPSGWDWVGANLDDGSALMAFQIRGKDGAQYGPMPESATLRPLYTVRAGPGEIRTTAHLALASYRCDLSCFNANPDRLDHWLLTPLMDDQELDSRQSTGAVYWEGAVTITRDGKPAGHGYLELTGYVEALKL